MSNARDARDGSSMPYTSSTVPSAVTRVETRRAAVEGRIEQLAAPEIGADLGCGEASIR
jgi:hypothetical protein